VTATDGATITGTTVRDNLADYIGGGIAITSGTIRDSTVVANAVGPGAPFGGGRDVACNGSGALLVANTTIDELFTFAYCEPTGGGSCITSPDIVLANVTAEEVRFLMAGPGGSVTARNSIIRTNNAALISQGYNLIQVTNSNIVGDTTGNQIGVDPLLGPLADNGGPTPTRHPLFGSPAVDAANPALPGSGGAACEATDQRGVARPVGPRCDIGAVETQCGDGVVQPGESCDDGTRPTVTAVTSTAACGNGVVAPGEQCDDGNTTAGDCCGTTCLFETSGASCSDGDVCTTGDHCSDGACIGAGCDPCLSCDAVAGCVMPTCSTVLPATSASVRLRRGSTDARDRVTFRWQDGPVAKVEFADPRVVTPRLCVYDGAGNVILSARAPEETCASGCWTDTTHGYRYVDRALDPDGISSMKLNAGDMGKIRVKGKGANLKLGALSPTLPVRARLLGQNGATCFGADFTTATTSSATDFRARLP
jgi:cysteine-rich repeat protein